MIGRCFLTFCLAASCVSASAQAQVRTPDPRSKEPANRLTLPATEAQPQIPADWVARSSQWTQGNQFLLPNDGARVIRPDSDTIVPGEAVCLKMRAYRVKRDAPDSDSTHLVGYTTCHPAARFSLKTTEKPVDVQPR